MFLLFLSNEVGGNQTRSTCALSLSTVLSLTFVTRDPGHLLGIVPRDHPYHPTVRKAFGRVYRPFLNFVLSDRFWIFSVWVGILESPLLIMKF